MKKQLSAISHRPSPIAHCPSRTAHRPWRIAFTLIELLVVIAIIAILAGLLFPAIRGAMLKAKNAQAKMDVKSVENAIKQYQTEYGKFPVPDADQGVADKTYLTTGGSEQYQMINTLRAIAVSGQWNASDKLNPRRIVFFEPPSRKNCIDSSGYFLDPWSVNYRIKLDNNYDNIVGTYGVNITNLTMVITSFGPDKALAPNPGPGDDVTNYQ